MDKVKHLFKKHSIKTTFTFYMIMCILCAILLSLFFSSICQLAQSQFYKKYEVEYKNTKVEANINYDENANHIIGFHTKSITSFFTPFEKASYDILGFLSVAVYPTCFVICILATSVLFYKKQLQKPLGILDKAMDSIAENNLDFNISYKSQNELGKLCSSFEKMRITLQNNNFEMWRQLEERKQLNAAFSHDLRTPLTVLKGQSDMIVQYGDQMTAEKIISTAKVMKKHINRLESYVDTMNNLQRLEDIPIDKRDTKVKDLISQLTSTGNALCINKQFTLLNNCPDEYGVNIDLDIVLQVYENLLSNAVRYAKEQVSVSISTYQNSLSISVCDDGKGFSDEDLQNATKPFYKSSTKNKVHFGMGLSICKILCEKHGGYLKLSNNNGAAVKAVF